MGGDSLLGLQSRYCLLANIYRYAVHNNYS